MNFCWFPAHIWVILECKITLLLPLNAFSFGKVEQVQWEGGQGTRNLLIPAYPAVNDGARNGLWQTAQFSAPGTSPCLPGSRCIQAYPAVPPPSHCARPSTAPTPRPGAGLLLPPADGSPNPPWNQSMDQPRIPRQFIPRCFPRIIPGEAGSERSISRAPGDGSVSPPTAAGARTAAAARTQPRRAIVWFCPGTPSAPRLHNPF